jgi:spore coat polysaccharide biosynthesis protein SpsF
MKIKFPTIIAVRMGSSRLPGKTLKKFLDGESMLDKIIKRISQSEYTSKIIIATTTNPEDDELESYCKENKIDIFRGSDTNVALRVMQAANRFDSNYFYEVLGDNPFIDPKFFELLHNIYLTNDDLKYASFNTKEYNFNKETEFPVGIRVQLIKTDEMQKIQILNNDYFFEHATSFFYDKINQNDYFLIENKKWEIEMSNSNLAVNELSDFYTAGLLLNEIKTTDWEEVYYRFNFLKNYKSNFKDNLL